MKLKVISIVGTRPEIIRLSMIFKKMDLYFNHIIINTMQNYNNYLNKNFFKELNLRDANYFLSKNDSISTGKIIGNIISETYDIFQKENPDCILILGDTNSGLSAIAAKKLHIPIFHMEAGNRSFDYNLPEEINRKIIDEISDINLPYSERARNNLLAEGKVSNEIFKIGSPLKEVIDNYYSAIKSSDILDKLSLNNNSYILVSIHRKENLLDLKIENILNNISKIGHHFSKKIILSLHPTTRSKIEKLNIEIPDNFLISEPYGFFDYCKLQINSFCVISDSGSLAEESYMLNFKAVSVRNSTERQEAIEDSNFILGNLDFNSLVNSIEIINSVKNKVYCSAYEESHVSDKIVRIIQSYAKIAKKKYSS